MKNTRLIYVGRRMLSGSLSSAFLQTDGTLAHFKSAERYLSIGDVVEGQVPGKNQLQIHRRPKELEATKKEVELIEREREAWKIQDRLARTERDKISAAKKSHEAP